VFTTAKRNCIFSAGRTVRKQMIHAPNYSKYTHKKKAVPAAMADTADKADKAQKVLRS